MAHTIQVHEHLMMILAILGVAAVLPVKVRLELILLAVAAVAVLGAWGTQVVKKL
jgi:hypothetical protein